MATGCSPRALVVANARWAPLRLARNEANAARVRMSTSLAPGTEPSSYDLAAVSVPTRKPDAHRKSLRVLAQPRGNLVAVATAKALPLAPTSQISDILAAKRLRNATPALRLALEWLGLAELRLLGLPEESRSLPAARWIAHERRRVMQAVFAGLASVPVALREARVMLDKMKEEGVVPSSRGLTVYIKTMVDSPGCVTALAVSHLNSPSSTSPTTLPSTHSILSVPPAWASHVDIRSHLDEILSLHPTLDPPLLTTILSAHIRIGTSTSSILDTIKACMASTPPEVEEEIGKAITWPSALFGLLIKAHKRDGDMKGVMQWFLAYRRSRLEELARTARAGINLGRNSTEEQGQNFPSDQGSSGTSRPTYKADGVSQRWHESALTWPYTAFFDALESSPNTRAGLVGARFGSIGRVLTCMQQDQVEPPPRLLEAMIQHARKSGSYTVAIACWNLFGRGREMKKRQPRLGPFIEILRVMSTESLTEPSRLPLEPILCKLFPGGLEDITRRNLLRDADLKMARSLLTQLIAVTLSPAYLDFNLACKLANHFGSHGLTVTSETVDTLAKSMLLHLVRRRRSAGWCRSVFGKRGEEFGVPAWTRGRSRIRMRDRSLGKLKLTPGHWDLLVERLAELESPGSAGGAGSEQPPRKLVAPISWPLARLAKVPSGEQNRLPAASRTTHDYVRQRDERRIRGEAEMKDRIWISLKELMRKAAGCKTA